MNGDQANLFYNEVQVERHNCFFKFITNDRINHIINLSMRIFVLLVLLVSSLAFDVSNYRKQMRPSK